MRSDTFPSTKIGKQYYVTEDNFNKWLENHKYKTVEFFEKKILSKYIMKLLVNLKMVNMFTLTIV